MCRICESSETVKRAAEELTDAIADRQSMRMARGPVGVALARAMPIDPEIPDDMVRAVGRIRLNRSH